MAAKLSCDVAMMECNLGTLLRWSGCDAPGIYGKDEFPDTNSTDGAVIYKHFFF